MAKRKVTLTVDRGLWEEVDRVSGAEGKKKTQIVEDALRLWKESRLVKEMKEGYLAMAKDTSALVRRGLPSELESAEGIWEWED
jgi:metal-responsive CopG/Arc/MetJ family transcriptional regulator